MPLVECRNGYAETFVGGAQYTFEADKHGRYVAQVENSAHLHCFLAREDMYAVVPETPKPRVGRPPKKTEAADEPAADPDAEVLEPQADEPAAVIEVSAEDQQSVAEEALGLAPTNSAARRTFNRPQAVPTETP